MEMFADDKTLKLRKTSSGTEVATLDWGENLIRFVSRLTSVNQVGSVEVIGWDAKTKQTIIGVSSTSNSHPQTGEGSKSNNYASTFGTAKVASVYRPVTNQSEASNIAQAIYDDLTGRFIQAEGSCIGDSRLQPGNWIKVGKIGQKYGGKFYLTACTHRYTPKGYLTDFEANGRQTNTWLELTNQPGERGGNEAVNSVVIGIVTNNKDPDNMGRVKVKFPCLPTNEGTNIESTWARIVSPMAGSGRSFMFLPEVNDEVLIGFERGDVQHPFVMGQLWNGKDAPPLNANQIVAGDGKVKQRILKTLSGHTLTFDDSEEAAKITIIDKTNNNKITIDSVTNLITIESKEGDITVESKQGNVNLKASAGKITLDAKEIEIKSATSGKVEVTTLELKASASAKLNAATLEIVASGTAKLDGGGMLEVKGGLVKIN